MSIAARVSESEKRISKLEREYRGFRIALDDLRKQLKKIQGDEEDKES